MDQKKKQIIALFILVVFIFSGFAFAIISSLTGGNSLGTVEDLKPIYNQPLPATDEQAIISSGKVIVKIFSTQDCNECGPAVSEVLKLFQKLSTGIIVEQIDTTYFPEEIQANNLEKFPTIIILGKGSERIEGSSAELFQKVCSQFTSKPAACA